MHGVERSVHSCLGQPPPSLLYCSTASMQTSKVRSVSITCSCIIPTLCNSLLKKRKPFWCFPRLTKRHRTVGRQGKGKTTAAITLTFQLLLPDMQHRQRLQMNRLQPSTRRINSYYSPAHTTTPGVSLTSASRALVQHPVIQLSRRFWGGSSKTTHP